MYIWGVCLQGLVGTGILICQGSAWISLDVRILDPVMYQNETHAQLCMAINAFVQPDSCLPSDHRNLIKCHPVATVYVHAVAGSDSEQLHPFRLDSMDSSVDGHLDTESWMRCGLFVEWYASVEITAACTAPTVTGWGSTQSYVVPADAWGHVVRSWSTLGSPERGFSVLSDPGGSFRFPGWGVDVRAPDCPATTFRPITPGAAIRTAWPRLQRVARFVCSVVLATDGHEVLFDDSPWWIRLASTSTMNGFQYGLPQRIESWAAAGVPKSTVMFTLTVASDCDRAVSGNASSMQPWWSTQAHREILWCVSDDVIMWIQDGANMTRGNTGTRGANGTGDQAWPQGISAILTKAGCPDYSVSLDMQVNTRNDSLLRGAWSDPDPSTDGSAAIARFYNAWELGLLVNRGIVLTWILDWLVPNLAQSVRETSSVRGAERAVTEFFMQPPTIPPGMDVPGSMHGNMSDDRVRGWWWWCGDRPDRQDLAYTGPSSVPGPPADPVTTASASRCIHWNGTEWCRESVGIDPLERPVGSDERNPSGSDRDCALAVVMDIDDRQALGWVWSVLWVLFNQVCLSVDPIRFPRVIGSCTVILIEFVFVVTRILSPAEWGWYTLVACGSHACIGLGWLVMELGVRKRRMRICTLPFWRRLERVVCQYLVMGCTTAYLSRC